MCKTEWQLTATEPESSLDVRAFSCSAVQRNDNTLYHVLIHHECMVGFVAVIHSGATLFTIAVGLSQISLPSNLPLLHLQIFQACASCQHVVFALSLLEL